jgi:hypothetical protein
MSSGINLPLNVTVGTTPISNGTNNTLLRNEGGVVGDTDYTVPKTDGTAGQVLQTNGAGVVSFQTIATGITVGTTAVTSGTDGRVFFQAGGVIEQDAAFFWDNTNKRLGVGATPASTVRLDVRAQGALSTDIAFRVRNSADTRDAFEITGNEITRVRADGNASSALPLQIQSATNAFSTWLGLEIRQTTRVGNFSLQSQGLQNNYNNVRFSSGGFQSRISAYITQTDTDRQGHWQFRTQVHLGDAIRTYNNNYGLQTLVIENATAPSATPTDGFVQYSADITAGNAAPHFRTENGAIVKVYQETTGVGASTLVTGVGTPLTDTDTFDGYTLKQIVKALRNQGLLA